MDPSEIGRYGTLRLMKRLEPNTSIAAFPIDDEELTIGRDPSCSLRLYYPSVSALHGKIVFQDRKAFLIVLGANGLLVDGCQVYPSSQSSPSAGPTTIPLPNNTHIEIHKKQFVFTYPPKELRAALLATPRDPKKRGLRMSMIQSAEVFSPRPSQDPRENLRVLQSPIKSRTRRESSPLKRGVFSREEEPEDEEEIVLVDGNHPRVVEEDKDLVILEDVDTPPISSVPTTPAAAHTTSFKTTAPAPSTPKPRTPAMRGMSSLHRAVLIRSAQRAVLKAEMEMEEEEEEREVAGAVVGVDEEDEEEEYDEATNGDVDMDGDEEEEEQYGDEKAEEEGVQASGWRKSLEAVKGFVGLRSSSATPNDEQDEQDEETSDNTFDPTEEDDTQDDRDEQDEDNENEGEDERQDQFPSSPPTPPRTGPRALGGFMTPQLSRPHTDGLGTGVGRYSIGGASGMGARRVRVEPKWKVKDIVVDVAGRGTPKREVDDGGGAMSTPKQDGARARLSDEERKAIQERRRSALTTPNTLTFSLRAPDMRLPEAAFSDSTTPSSPFKNPAGHSYSTPRKISEGEEGEDTRRMLERMRETVEGMKRRSIGVRQSLGGVGARMSLSPRKAGGGGGFSLLAPEVQEEEGGVENEEAGAEDQEEEDEEPENDENAPIRLGADARSLPTSSREDVEMQYADADMEEGEYEEPANNDNQLVPTDHTTVPPTTPSFKGMRELFKVPPAIQTQTPRMDGMRDMFFRAREREIGTPVFEGVGEMIRTPEGYRSGQQEEAYEGDEHADTPATSTKMTPALITSKVPATRRRGKTIPADVSNLADDEATPSETVARRAGTDSEGEEQAPAPRRGRLLRGRKPVTATEAIPEVEEQLKTAPEKRVESSAESSKMTSKPTLDEPPVKAARRVRKAAPTADKQSKSNVNEPTLQRDEPEDNDSEPPVAVTKPAPARRGRKPTAESGTSTNDEAKSARRKTPAPAEETKSKRGTRTKPIAVDEDDPLDSLGGGENESEDIPVVKKRSGKIKEEPTEDESVGASKTRTARGKATPTPSSAKATPATRTRSAKKAADVVTPAAAELGIAGNKENSTPDTIEEEDNSAKPKTKGKVGRPRKVKQEEGESEPVEAPVPKSTRVTRTKARK